MIFFSSEDLIQFRYFWRPGQFRLVIHVGVVDLVPWTLFFDGSLCGSGSGIGVVLISPRGTNFEFSFTIEASAINNQAEYRAILKGIQLLREIKADAIEIFWKFYAGDELVSWGV